MNKEQLDQIEKEIMASMEQEDSLEERVVAWGKDIAERLMADKGAVTEEIEGRELVFNYRVYQQNSRNKIFMTVANPFMYKVGADKYKPYMVDVEIDHDLSMYESLSATVEAFLRHILGLVKAQELDD